MSGRRAGIISGTLVALYPPLLANDTVTPSEPFLRCTATTLSCGAHSSTREVGE